MVDIDIAGVSPSGSVVVTIPSPALGGAVAASDYIRAVPAESIFARVAISTDGDPVLEGVAVAGRAVRLGCDGEFGEVGLCC